jgi:4-hydroxybenzoate polyprenyltransferase
MVFSAAASSIYIINDLMDLEADRKHETKRKRPFAAGAATILSGMGVSALLALGALGSALWLSWQMAAIIALYMVLSLSYSLGLKRLRWVDIATLAALYTLRVVAGSVAVGVPMSGWLGAFIFPIFLALGGVKRLVELGKAKDEAPLPGRGYARRDRADLRNIAITASVGALVVYTLYTYSEIAAVLYNNPLGIRLAAIPVALWLGRMITLGWQGRMDYDPIVFALRDPIGLALVGAGAFMLMQAAG